VVQRRRELYGETFGLVGALGTAFGATLPIVGKGYVERLIFMNVGNAALGAAAEFRPYWNTLTPTSDATLRTGEPVFPQVREGTGVRGDMQISVANAPLEIVGPFWAEPEGRRMGFSVYNHGANGAMMSVLLVWRPSDAEQSDEPLRRVGDR
jgi:hypothetical protein